MVDDLFKAVMEFEQSEEEEQKSPKVTSQTAFKTMSEDFAWNWGDGIGN